MCHKIYNIFYLNHLTFTKQLVCVCETVYPCPLFSVRFRKPLFGETGHTIINLLAVRRLIHLSQEDCVWFLCDNYLRCVTCVYLCVFTGLQELSVHVTGGPRFGGGHGSEKNLH